MTAPRLKGRIFIARHGETVFNAAARIQGDVAHTPLTRAGFAQADEMGAALRQYLGPHPVLTLWSSPAGRALQTLAVIAEHLELDWHEARIDARLEEIGMGEWSGRLYRELAAEHGALIDRETWLFTRPAPTGEWYDAVAARLRAWIGDQADAEGDRLVVMHGMSSRVLRGLLTGMPERPECGAPVADSLPQGSLVEVADGVERMIHFGGGAAPD
ncbi:MAG TPA: histidine phosphatase family protein [Allosphingosinicella sp.]